MARKASNTLLQKAKKSKSDEFYTQRCDIEKELQHYLPHFAGKTVFCNCDDPRISNFFKYFTDNFAELKLNKVIASCYKERPEDRPDGSVEENGFYAEYDQQTAGDRGDDLNVTYFNGDGDFRSAESIALLQKADIVVTNPPFSLFREYLAQLIGYQKKFLVIANVNAITYKEVFNLIQNNKMWLGVHLGRGVSGFIVPPHYELYGTETRVDELGNQIISPNNCLWLTNLDLSIRHEDIPLTKKYVGNEGEYLKYDNYDGINVNKTKDIPADYAGVMGVPITFLHKFNPEQFEIIQFRKGNDSRDLSINGKCPYFRILIKNRRLQAAS